MKKPALWRAETLRMLRIVEGYGPQQSSVDRLASRLALSVVAEATKVALASMATQVAKAASKAKAKDAEYAAADAAFERAEEALYEAQASFHRAYEAREKAANAAYTARAKCAGIEENQSAAKAALNNAENALSICNQLDALLKR
jgi:hypothetical protein